MQERQTGAQQLPNNSAKENQSSYSVTFDLTQCEFSMSSLTFLNHSIDHTGISAKISAIKDMPRSKNVTELQRRNGQSAREILS